MPASNALVSLISTVNPTDISYRPSKLGKDNILTVPPTISPPLPIPNEPSRRRRLFPRIGQRFPLRTLLLFDALLGLLGVVNVTSFHRELIRAQTGVGRREQARFKRGDFIELDAEG
jgi:hypothetical protein